MIELHWATLTLIVLGCIFTGVMTAPIPHCD